jgi:hypothetical protein
VAHQEPSSGTSWLQYFLFIQQKILQKFRGIRRTFISAQKQHHGSSAENSVSPGLVSFKSCKLESKTRAKGLGKVDTLETYHSSTPLPEETMVADENARPEENDVPEETAPTATVLPEEPVISAAAPPANLHMWRKPLLLLHQK